MYMASAPLDDGDQMVSVSRSRLQELEFCALRAELDAQNIQLLQEQVKKLEGALGTEQARSEQMASAFADVARACDNRARDLEEQYATKLAKLDSAHDAAMAAKDATMAAKAAAITGMERRFVELDAAHARTVAAKDAAFAKLERDHAALRAEVVAQLSAVHAAVTSKLALEIGPVRADGLQYATVHVGSVPLDTFAFDTAWCAAAAGARWKIDIDPLARARAHVVQCSRSGSGYLTLRGATPLPRRVPSACAPPQQLASCRVVIEAYPVHPDGKEFLNVGFLPSHAHANGALVTPVVGRNIHHYGGWWFQVKPAVTCGIMNDHVFGWIALTPRADSGSDADEEEDTSTYATTDDVPPVPAGSAVEFAVDYAAGTCRVAFFTPAAVAGGFVGAPYAKMELRFVATDAVDMPDWGTIPARSVPTGAACSRVQLYPAVAGGYAGTILRFV
jgi:hypothetical protein